jgi:hypothetical protein
VWAVILSHSDWDHNGDFPSLGKTITAGRSPANSFGEPREVRVKSVSLNTCSDPADNNEQKHYVEPLPRDVKNTHIKGEEKECLTPAEPLRAVKPQSHFERIPTGRGYLMPPPFTGACRPQISLKMAYL